MSKNKMMPKIKLAALYIVCIAVFYAFSKLQIYVEKLLGDVYMNLLLFWDAGIVFTVLRITLILMFIVFYIKIVRTMELNRSYLFYILSGVLALAITILNNHLGFWLWRVVDIQAVLKTAGMVATVGTLQIFLGILMKMNIRLAV